MTNNKVFISDALFEEVLEEMNRRINQPKHINISADGYEADGNSDWLPTYDTQVGVEFAVDFLSKRAETVEDITPTLIEALQEARTQISLLQSMRGIVDTGHGTLSIIDAALAKAIPGYTVAPVPSPDGRKEK